MNKLTALIEAAKAAPPEPAPRLPEGCMWAVTKGGYSICQPPKSFYQKGAAPSSEEVRDAVARLSDRFYDLDEGDCKRISDLIERLAARVPSITHDEWYAAQNRISELLIFVKKISKQIPEKPDYWNSCSQCEHNASEAEDLLIAAGEVK